MRPPAIPQTVFRQTVFRQTVFRQTVFRQTVFPQTVFRLALLVSLASAIGCGSEEAVRENVAPAVRVFEVGEKATGQTRRISGRLEALEQAALSFGVGGKVAEIVVEQGGHVTENQLIARLDDSTLSLALGEASNKLTQARAELGDARTAQRRMRTLREKGGASQQELDAATLALANADAQVSITENAVSRAQIDLSRTNLKAPFSGSIVDVPADPFQEVSAAETIVAMQSDGALKIEVLVPESLIRDVEYGQAVTVTSSILKDRAFPGTVALIGAEAGEGNAYPVTIQLSGDLTELRPGMTASVAFSFDKYLAGVTAYLIPLTSIAVDIVPSEESHQEGRPEQAPVFVFDQASSSVQQRLVTVGNLRGNQVEVLSGLKAGDLVVSAGVSFVRDGMQAKVWTPRN